jgi:hypothetical protein
VTPSATVDVPVELAPVPVAAPPLPAAALAPDEAPGAAPAP